jgi:hypothetical protein
LNQSFPINKFCAGVCVLQGIQSDDVMAEAVAFWQSALAKENEAIAAGIKAAADGSRPATAPSSTGLISIKVRLHSLQCVISNAALQEGSPWVHHVPHPSLLLPPPPQAFMDAGVQCNFIRAYVRLHKTPPAKLRVENSDTEQV